MDTTTVIFVILATILAGLQGLGGDFTISWSYQRTVNGFFERNIKIDFPKIALAVFGVIILFRTLL